MRATDSEYAAPARVRGAGPLARRGITVVIPAHNEAAVLAATLASVREQTWTPDRVVVVCDNCTDETLEIAQAFGCQIIVTKDNRYRKAGALNQAFDLLLPPLDDHDLILVMDADTRLDQDFLAMAEQYADAGYVAVAGVCQVDDGSGYLGAMQRNEYARYARKVGRRRGSAEVLCGAATIFTVEALREVERARRTGELPGRGGRLRQEQHYRRS